MDKEKQKEAFGWVAACLEMEEAERMPFLEHACANDPELLSEAREILEACTEADDFLEEPMVDMVSEFPESDSLDINEADTLSEIPDRIGPYKILKPIGKGGMGLVYLAHQEEPVMRQVALKIIRWGIGASEILRRFSIEYQMLAQLNHPNVACVFHAGSWEGRPYFTMEYFPGMPINEFCRENGLNVRERLTLFLQACAGVSHAHRNSIIHRDLKPRNILVKNSQMRPSLKVIDFGIAKAIGSAHISGLTIQTAEHHVLGTPAYMSPEQINSGQDIDTRTDVYSLGAILYELLTGSTPFNARRLEKCSLMEMMKIIRNEEPPLPSVKLARGKHTMGSTHSRMLRGDLDWITMKALSKNPDDRYESVSEFGRDIQRFLDCLPVVAGPPSMLYKVRKFTFRHKWIVLATLLFISFFGLLTIERVRARQEQFAKNAVINAMTEMLVAENGYTIGDPAESRSILDRVAQAVSEHGERVPNALFERLSYGYSCWGEHEKALKYIDYAIQNVEADTFELNRLKTKKASFLRFAGKYQDAEKLYKSLLAFYSDENGSHDIHTIKVRRGLFESQIDRRGPNSIEEIKELLNICSSLFGPDHSETLKIMLLLGNYYLKENRVPEAKELYEKVWVAQARSARGVSPETLNAKYNLCIVLNEERKFEESESILRTVFESSVIILGRAHRKTLQVSNVLGNNLRRQSKLGAAEEILRDTFLIQKEVLGLYHVDTMDTTNNLAIVLGQRGKHHEAICMLGEVLAQRFLLYGYDSVETLKIENNLADYLFKAGYLEDSQFLMEGILDIVMDKHGLEDDFTWVAMITLAEAYMHTEGHDQALVLLDDLAKVVSRDWTYWDYFLDQYALNLKTLRKEQVLENFLLSEYEQRIAEHGFLKSKGMEERIIDLYKDWCPDAAPSWEYKVPNPIDNKPISTWKGE